jgi:AraC-like DNA-binding protein
MNQIFESNMLYSEEHFGCPNYRHEVTIGFKYREFPHGSLISFDDLSTNIIVFMMKGVLKCDCCNDGISQINAGQMIFLPAKSMCNLNFEAGSAIVSLAFEKCSFVCHTKPLHDLRKLVPYVNNFSNVLHINSQLQAFLDLLTMYLRNGVSCVAFHNLKIDELFILFRHFYSKEQLAVFMAPMLGASQEFRLNCLRMRSNSRNITELVSMSGMSKTKFYDKFRKEFGDVNPKKWFDSYLEYRILRATSEPGVSVKELAYRFEFESESAFSQFCHRHFGVSASELIRNRRPQIESV